MPVAKGRRPGTPKTGGRAAGTPNKSTMETREAFKRLLEHNTPNMIEWLDRVAADDPAKALSLCADLAEFVVPKLARMEHSGDQANPVRYVIQAPSVADSVSQWVGTVK